MEQEQEVILVCGTFRMPPSVERLCSWCGVSIFPNANNLARVDAEKITLICLDCSLSQENPVFRGVMSNGKITEDALAVEVYKRYQEAMMEKENNE